MSTEAKKNCKDLEVILRQSFGDDVVVLSCSSDSLLSVGENFGSDIVRISAKVQRDENSPVEKHDFVAKKVLAEVSDFGNWTVVVEREVFMYTDILPLYARMEVESGEKESIAENVAKFYGYRILLDPRTKMAGRDSLILLENIKVKGYYICDKKAGKFVFRPTLFGWTIL